MAMKSYAPSAVARGFALGVFGAFAVRAIADIIVRDGFFADEEESAPDDAWSSAVTPSPPSTVGSVESFHDDDVFSASDVDDVAGMLASPASTEETWRTRRTTTTRFATMAFRGLQCAAWTFVLGPVVQSVLADPPESRF
jgi:hypothetical protein